MDVSEIHAIRLNAKEVITSKNGENFISRFAASRSVFILKTSTIDDNGRIVRSPAALRPLTLCNCDCKF